MLLNSAIFEYVIQLVQAAPSYVATHKAAGASRCSKGGGQRCSARASGRPRRSKPERTGRHTVSKNIPLTLACGDYEIVRPLKEGTIKPDGIDLTVLTAMDSTTRHWRFLRGKEFDVAEVSCSSFIVARDQG